MSRREQQPELEGELKRVWEVGANLVEHGKGVDIALLQFKGGIYLMLGDSGSRWAATSIERLVGEAEGLTWQLLSSYQELQEAVPESKPSPNDGPWDTYRSAIPERWNQVHPSLFALSGNTFEFLKGHFMRLTFHSVALLDLDDSGALDFNSLQKFPSWTESLGDSRESFFESRGIQNGEYYCNGLNEEVLNFYAEGAKAGASGNTPIYCDPKFSLSQCGSNGLFYNGISGEFEFKVNLVANDASTVQIFEAIMHLTNFIFLDVQSFKQQGNDFLTFLSEHKNIEESLLTGRISGIGELFSDHDDRFASREEWWVDPDLVKIQVRTCSIDPSFGVLAENETTVYLESRENWARTDFNKVSPTALLGRLRAQAAGVRNTAADGSYGRYSR